MSWSSAEPFNDADEQRAEQRCALLRAAACAQDEEDKLGTLLLVHAFVLGPAALVFIILSLFIVRSVVLPMGALYFLGWLAHDLLRWRRAHNALREAQAVLRAQS